MSKKEYHGGCMRKSQFVAVKWFLLRKILNYTDFWIYGTCNNMQARKHKIKGNVQFIMFKIGDQKYVDGVGHLKNRWIDFDSSWWGGFIAY